jgi:HemX protein
MITISWIYDAMMYLYALSLLFIFSDFIERNPRAKQLGTGLLAFVWIIQSLFLITRMWEGDQFSLFSSVNTLLFFSWIIVTLSIVLHYILHIDFLLFMINLAGFIVAAITFFSDERISPVLERWEVRDELLFIHISLAVGSYAAFLLSAIFSGMLLFLHARLKNKKWSPSMKRMPSLDHIQKYALRSVIIGTPLLLLSLALGIVWISLSERWSLLGDVKVITSILILVVYSFYLWKRYVGKSSWSRLAILNVIAFSIVVFNYAFTNWFSGFHG